MTDAILRIATPVISMACLGLIFGTGLAYTLKLFRIEVDPKVALIITKLPGANCGACGAAGCGGFASLLVKGDAVPSGCAVANEQMRQEIAGILGVADERKVRMAAVLFCNGGKRAVEKFAYSGIRSCAAANVVFAGQKACTYGCLGFGDCIRVCPFGALKMGTDGLPVVDELKCTACGRCVKVCPKKLYHHVAVDKKYYVKCSSKDPGAVAAKICKGGCIACHRCEKVCPRLAIKVDAFLAHIDYKICENIGRCFEACPTKVIQKR